MTAPEGSRPRAAAVAARDARTRLRVLIAFLVLYTIWGSTYLAIRVGVRGLPPALFAGIRFLIAGGLLLLIARWRGHPLPRTLAHVWPLAIIGFLLLVGGNALVVWAEQYVESGLASLILAVTPFIMVGIDSALPGGEQIDRRSLFGLVVGFAGFVVLVSPDLRGALGGEALAAKAALLVASLSWAIGSLYSKRRGVPVNAIVATGVEMLIGGAILFAIGLAGGDLARARWDRDTLFALTYLIVFGAVIGFTAYVWLLDRVAPSRIATISYVTPLVALALGWALLGETLTPRVLVAAVVIVAGVVLVTTSRRNAAAS
jgi:drug/metabolite transporter (DMT)-like permease